MKIIATIIIIAALTGGAMYIRSSQIEPAQLPTEVVIQGSQIKVGCGSGYTGIDQSFGYSLVFDGSGKVSYSGRKGGSESRSAETTIKPEVYKQFILRAYQEHIFSWAKFEHELIMDAGGCIVEFTIDGNKTSVESSQLWGKSEEVKFRQYVNDLTAAVNLTEWLKSIHVKNATTTAVVENKPDPVKKGIVKDPQAAYILEIPQQFRELNKPKSIQYIPRYEFDKTYSAEQKVERKKMWSDLRVQVINKMQCPKTAENTSACVAVKIPDACGSTMMWVRTFYYKVGPEFLNNIRKASNSEFHPPTVECA